MQRREHGRYRIWFPVRVTGPNVDGMAFNQNISAGGMLVGVSTRLAIGATVEVRFSVPMSTQGERVLRGQVARLETNSEDPEGMWPYRMAVAFEEADPDLIPILEQAIKQLEA